MNITLKPMTVRQLHAGYQDLADLGVVAYGSKLDVRPAFQREFIYDTTRSAAVIDSMLKGYPINVMYWTKKDGDGADESYELLDGQQRTISICHFLESKFAVQMQGNPKYFHNMTPSEQSALLDYSLMVYVCAGTDSEKLEWFKIINVGGALLTDQELRNACYTGPWLSDAKSYFSKVGGGGHTLAGKYVKARVERQELLECAIKWADKKVENYMAKHQQDPDAKALKTHFERVIAWVQKTFPHQRDIMKTVPWGDLYAEFKNNTYNSTVLEAKIAALLLDDEVENKKGIYAYVLGGDPKHLQLRAFTKDQRLQLYEQQGGICGGCHKLFDLEQMEADHVVPWSKGGKTHVGNGRMLCMPCNRTKSDT